MDASGGSESCGSRQQMQTHRGHYQSHANVSNFKNLILIFHQQDTDCFFVLILTQGSLSWWIRVYSCFTQSDQKNTNY